MSLFATASFWISKFNPTNSPFGPFVWISPVAPTKANTERSVLFGFKAFTNR
jgi:hypothetical protein